ncbi:N-formylglutamate amidohydrolase [Labrys monachus]|uniref:N-formylglutamate amidohydrolase n=1 Tax=Labrys monachus TaxID=217067 RepID=A0ABU0FNH6_9HYPH|nr:N-formylglutamate amidohydrolase [Labrys monachus]MDQ0396081.1 putative N-formylglutamate amidohydrolase [Labrys monachus]
MAPKSASTDFSPLDVLEGDAESGLILLCDHASNALPPEYGTLGLPPSQLERHIGYDIGAAAVTRDLARRLRAPALLTRFSRLLIDPNRGADDPTLVMRLSDGALVPGNARIGREEVLSRIERFYRPYHKAVAALVNDRLARDVVPILFAVHSFTPVWRGVPRPWHVTLLWDNDPRVARPLIEAFGRDPGLVVGDNEPYDGALEGDTLYQHATLRGLPNALVEIRQDLIGTQEGAEDWGARLALALSPLLADPTIRRIEHYGSRTAAVPPPAARA